MHGEDGDNNHHDGGDGDGSYEGGGGGGGDNSHHNSDECQSHEHDHDGDEDRQRRVILFIIGTIVVLVVLGLLCCICKKKTKRRTTVQSMGHVVVSPQVQGAQKNASIGPTDEKCMNSFEILEVTPNAPGMPPVDDPARFGIAPPEYRSTMDLREPSNENPREATNVMSPPPKYEEFSTGNERY